MGLPGDGPRWSDRTLKTNISTDYAREFHIFELNWTEKFLAFSVDGEEIYRHHRQKISSTLILMPQDFRLTAPGPPGGLFVHAGLPGDNIWATGGPMAPFATNFHFIISAQSGENCLTFCVLTSNYLYNEDNPKIARVFFPVVLLRVTSVDIFQEAGHSRNTALPPPPGTRTRE